MPSGTSMLPLLNGKTDKVTFSEKPERLKKYDVALYRRPHSGQLVLHRMIGFTKEGGYIFSGDHQYGFEYGITDADVLALMTAYTRGGRERSVTSFGYRVYCRAMLFTKRLYHLAVRVYRKVFK